MKAVQLLILVGMLHVAATIGAGMSNAPDVELMSNWKVMFHILDVNADNLVNNKDVEDSRSRYAAMTNARGELHPDLADKLDEWWSVYFFKISPENGEMTESQFGKSQNALFKIGKDGYEQFYNRLCNLQFEIFDTNSDGYISWEEFIVLHSVFGMHTMANDAEAFLEYEPEKQGISKTRLVETWAGLIVGAHDVWTGVLKDRLIIDGLQ